MPKFDKLHNVKHSAANMFDLVADVEKYPEFLPLCQSLNVRSRREKQGREMLIADMTAGYKSVSESFTSQVLLHKSQLAIDVSYIDGPFKYLNNSWRFEDAGDACCKVRFAIDYEFKNAMLGMLMGSMFDSAFKKFTSAFEARADELYGA